MTSRDRNIIPFPGREPQGALIVRVDLVMMPRPVWRRLRITADATFWDLHVAIQDAVGWGHLHRHLFVADHPDTGERLALGVPEGDTFHGRHAVSASWDVAVADVLRRDLPPALYTYHLGEQWLHEVCLEDAEPASEAGPAPECLDGAGLCPPEGCGGPDRYRELAASGRLDVSTDPAFDATSVRFCDASQLWRSLFGQD